MQVETGLLGFLMIGNLGGVTPFPPMPLLAPVPLATAQQPAVVIYQTEQGLNGYSLIYELTDGTSRREVGNLENGVWIVFWSAQWTDESKNTVRIVSHQNGVSWTIRGSAAVLPPREPPPPSSPGSPGSHSDGNVTDTTTPTLTVSGFGYQPGFQIDLKKDQGKPFFIQGCKDMYDKNKKIKGISCLAKASLAGGSAFINFT